MINTKIKKDKKEDKELKKSKAQREIIWWDYEGKKQLKKFESTVDASKYLNITQSGISSIINRKNLTYRTAYNLRPSDISPTNLYEGNMVEVLDAKTHEVLSKHKTFREAFSSIDLLEKAPKGDIYTLLDTNRETFVGTFKDFEEIAERYDVSAKDVEFAYNNGILIRGLKLFIVKEDTPKGDLKDTVEKGSSNLYYSTDKYIIVREGNNKYVVTAKDKYLLTSVIGGEEKEFNTFEEIANFLGVSRQWVQYVFTSSKTKKIKSQKTSTKYILGLQK